MKPVFRYAAAAWAVAASLFAFSYQPAAQDADEDAEPVMISRSYDVRQLSSEDVWEHPRTGAIGDVLAPDRTFFSMDFVDHRDEEWTLRDSGDEARCWGEAGEVIDTVYSLMRLGEDFECDYDGNSASVFEFSCEEEGHKRVQWVLDSLDDIVKTRVNMVVYRLTDADLPGAALNPEQTAALAKGARFVGTVRGGLGEPLVLQQTGHRSYVADYDYNVATEAAVSAPSVRELNTGEEFVLGALSLSNGEVWVQGWHASMNLEQMRETETTGGTVELPEVDYSYTPVSTVIPNGGGTVIDAGPAGRFLVKTTCSSVVRNHEVKLSSGGVVKLVNCVGIMRGVGTGGFWLMNPNSSRLVEDSMFPQVFMEERIDGPYNDSAIAMYERLGNYWEYCYVVGPYLGIWIPDEAALEEDFGDDEMENLRQATDVLDNLPSAPRTIGLRVSAWEVKDTAALPAGILQGRPSELDVAELATVAGGSALMNRVSASVLGQQVDLFEVKLATHVRDYESVTATGSFVLDPQIGTMVMGEQLRWQARESVDGQVRIDVRSGITVGSAEFESVMIGRGEDAWEVERSTTALTQARFGDELDVGERMATVSPGAGTDGQLVVIVIERIQ